jgi:drug/metabolite transporter (DMT)-like permease
LKSARLTHLLVLLLLAITWGSSFILMKRGLRDGADQPVLGPEQVAALRLGIAGLVLLPVSLPAIRKIRRSDWKFLAIVGLIGSGIPAILFTISQQYLDSSIAGILNALTPVFTLFIGILVFKKVVMPRQVLGVLIGLGGAVCLVAIKGIGDSANLAYSFLIVLATLCYGISVNTIAAKLKHISPLQITALSLLIAGIPWSLYLATTDVVQVISTNPHGYTSLAAVTTLAVFGTCMANLLYFWLTQQTSPLFASSVTYLMPLVAVGWGVFDNEKLTLMHLICGVIILVGVWMVNRK